MLEGLAGWLPAAVIAGVAALGTPPPTPITEAETPRRDRHAIVTNTEQVEHMEALGDSLWVATSGGVERYDLQTGTRTSVYTTVDGLASNHVFRLETSDDALTAHTRLSRCTLSSDTDRFECEQRGPRAVPRITVPRIFRGRRVASTVRAAGRTWVGTAGAGVWIDGPTPRRITPEGQIVSNHVVDVIEHDGQLWIGSFNDGLCIRRTDGTFESVAGPARMINDLESTPEGLYVASSEGLFRTVDGSTFEQIERIPRGANGLAFDGRSLFVSTPGSLWRLRIDGGPITRGWWRPGGSTAVQDVAVADDGVVWLATEDRGAIRIDGDDVRLFDRAAGLPTSWTLTVEVDTDGTAWVGTLRHGVIAIAPDHSHRTIQGTDAWLFRVRVQDDAVWLGTQGGAARLDRDGTVTELAHVPDPRVHEIVRIGDLRYVATESGMLVTTLPEPT